MIVVTFKGAPPPLLGRVKGVTVGPHVRGPSICAALVDAFQRFTIEQDVFLFVAPGGRIHSARIWPVVNQTNWDAAAFVDHLGSVPKCPGVFSGIGRVSLETLLVRPTAAGRRLLARWAERCAVRAGDEAVQLAIALVETRTTFLQLPRTWIWREDLHRTFETTAQPIVEFGRVPGPRALQGADPAPPPPPAPARPRPPEVSLVSHFYGYTGYGKLAREILFRLANSMNVRIADAHQESSSVDEATRARLDAHKSTVVGPRAPLLLMMGPSHTISSGWKGILTMQETSHRVHPGMVRLINQNFTELWTPSLWNAQTFRASGVRIPSEVIPLGVNSDVYRPAKRSKLPTCRLISTPRRGLLASPEGFIFLTIGVPGRKGWDVIARAMQAAFGKTKKVHLVIGLTYSLPGANQAVYKKFAPYDVPIWTLEGSFSEHELARIYSSCDAYVSASHGEGFNLPAAEAAACGLPVIVPNNTVHPEVFGPQAFLFDDDGQRPIPAFDGMSDWYPGMSFSHFGRKSVCRLMEILEAVHANGQDVRYRAETLRRRIVSKYNWNAAVSIATRRLMEVQP